MTEKPPGDPKVLARDLLVLGEIGKRVKVAETRLRREYADVADPGDRAVYRVGNQPVGSVAVANGATYARVTDADALLRWVRVNHPTEIHTVEAIRVSYLTRLLDAAKEAGEPVDPATGDAVPGITVETGAPAVRVVPAKNAGLMLEREWREGRLGVPGGVLPAIERGPQ